MAQKAVSTLPTEPTHAQIRGALSRLFILHKAAPIAVTHIVV
jgi:hypothetical protein